MWLPAGARLIIVSPTCFHHDLAVHSARLRYTIEMPASHHRQAKSHGSSGKTKKARRVRSREENEASSSEAGEALEEANGVDDLASTETESEEVTFVPPSKKAKTKRRSSSHNSSYADTSMEDLLRKLIAQVANQTARTQATLGDILRSCETSCQLLNTIQMQSAPPAELEDDVAVEVLESPRPGSFFVAHSWSALMPTPPA